MESLLLQYFVQFHGPGPVQIKLYTAYVLSLATIGFFKEPLKLVLDKDSSFVGQK